MGTEWNETDDLRAQIETLKTQLQEERVFRDSGKGRHVKIVSIEEHEGFKATLNSYRQAWLDAAAERDELREALNTIKLWLPVGIKTWDANRLRNFIDGKLNESEQDKGERFPKNQPQGKET